ncbi:MAG: ATP synthase F1 subunit gamma [Clostridia bacterium]|nr:ATP synthase F1 subunit gamma [Clostridia bacterium]
MGADIKQLRTRIKSVDSTLHLTKAMGLVASSKIRKAAESMNRGLEYAKALDEMVSRLITCEECKKTPYVSRKNGDRIRLVVIAGDRGLAGGYNANVFRLLANFPQADVIPIGKRACERFGKATVTAEHYSYDDAMALAQSLCRDFAEDRYDRLGILCTKYHSLMSQEAYVKWLLPLSSETKAEDESIVFEPDETTVLNALIPDYIAGMILSCVKESFASEVAARRVAMDNAGKNAQEMLDRLGLEYNRARQGAITQEITEIVAGSNT